MDLACVTCNAEICILDIRRLADFNETVLNEKANIMLNREFMRSDRYAFCKICTQIGQLEKAGSSRIMHCVSCDKRYCYECERAPHVGMSCKRYDENLFEGYAKMHTKPCPHCKALIEKNGGCNNIQCIACKKYMCWICGAGFQVQKEVYDHVNKKHPGKLFEVPPE